MLQLMLGIIFGGLLMAVNSWAQISVFQGSDGTSGTIVDLGNGFRTYSDSHGNMGTIMDLGGGFQTYQFSSPQGGSQSGTITTFGSPTPPSSITPAPILPFTPHSPVMPRGEVAPAAPFAPSSSRLVSISPGHSIGRSAVKTQTSGEVQAGP